MTLRKSRASDLSFRACAIACAAAVLSALPACAQAAGKQDKAFTIGNFPVEAKEANAVAAKDRAIAEGQQAAFRSLLRRIVPVSAYSRIPRMKAVKATELIEGFSVRSERNSSTEYIASYDFSFQAEAVRRVLDREGIPFLDRQAPQIVVVPVYRAPPEPGTPEVFTETRGSDAWLYAWKSLDLNNSLAPVNLQALKKEVHPDTIKALLDGDPAALRTAGVEYQTETLLIAYMEPQLEQKKVKVTIAGRDAVAPFVLRRTYRLDGPDLAYTAELAAVQALGVLEGRWKAINVRGGADTVATARQKQSDSQPLPVSRPGPGTEIASSTGDAPMRIAVEFRSMGEWQEISRQLSQTPNVSELDVEGLSARGARITLRHPGGAQGLTSALAQQGLTLRNGAGGLILSLR